MTHVLTRNGLMNVRTVLLLAEIVNNTSVYISKINTNNGDGNPCCSNSKVENDSTESDDESYSPPEVGLSFAACHLLLSPEADGFQLLVDSGS